MSERRFSAIRAPRTDPRPEFTDAVLVGLDDEVHVAAVLLDDVVHRRRVPGFGLGRLLLGEISTPNAFSPGAVPPCLFTGQV